MTILTIHHNIFLTSEERHKLVSGEMVKTIGISIPTWVVKSKSSEPAREVFCHYSLTNARPNEPPISFRKDGYQINIPPSIAENSHSTDERCGDNLLDIQEGGSECLIYKEHNKIYKDNETLEIIHYICIKDMNNLLNTIT